MITLAKPVRTEDVIQAIELACSPVLGALSMANAIGGLQTDAWRLVREVSLVALIDEASARDVDLSVVVAACCDVLVMDTPPFRHAVGYDPRPRCVLCHRRHYVDKSTGNALSCGDSQGFRNWPMRHWTKQTMAAAVEGAYKPEGDAVWVRSRS